MQPVERFLYYLLTAKGTKTTKKTQRGLRPQPKFAQENKI
jgi:hypothetical protein